LTARRGRIAAIVDVDVYVLTMLAAASIDEEIVGGHLLFDIGSTPRLCHCCFDVVSQPVCGGSLADDVAAHAEVIIPGPNMMDQQDATVKALHSSRLAYQVTH
jgi:hypothetical protein